MNGGGMSDLTIPDDPHLPECPLLEPCDDEVAEHGYCSMQHGVFCIHCHQWCICDRLRACEQRTLDAAREAVAGVSGHLRMSVLFVDRTIVLAAIDALREGKR